MQVGKSESITNQLELNGKSGRIEPILSKSEVDEDLLSVGQFLGDHTGGSQHGKTSVLKFLGGQGGEFLGIGGLQAEGVESDVSGVAETKRFG